MRIQREGLTFTPIEGKTPVVVETRALCVASTAAETKAKRTKWPGYQHKESG